MLLGGHKKLTYILLISLLSVIPIAAFVGIEFVQTTRVAQASLARTAAAAIQRTDAMLEDAEQVLVRLARDTDMSPSPETIRLLARAQYIDPRFREISLIDSRGLLVANSFGPVEPPRAIPAERRADPAAPTLQVLGVFRTQIMGENSIFWRCRRKGVAS